MTLDFRKYIHPYLDNIQDDSCNQSRFTVGEGVLQTSIPLKDIFYHYFHFTSVLFSLALDSIPILVSLQLQRSWAQKSTTSRVTCGPWESSCTFCK